LAALGQSRQLIGPVRTLSGLVSRARDLRVHTQAEGLHRALQGVDLGVVRGLQALSESQRAILMSTQQGGDGLPSDDAVAHLMSMISGDHAAHDPGRGALALLVQSAMAGEPASDTYPYREVDAADTLFTDEMSDVFGTAGSVIGYVMKLGRNSVVRWSGFGKEDRELQSFHGVMRMARSRFAALPDVDSQADGIALKKQHDEAAMNETHAFVEAQRAIMTEAEKEAEQQLCERICTVYGEEKPNFNAYFEALREVGGHPQSDRLNQLKYEYDEAIRNSRTLATNGIGPHEYQILAAHRRAANSISDPAAHRAAVTTAYRQEQRYVVTTLTARVTQMMKEGRPPSEWKKWEQLAAHAIRVYDRIIEGHSLGFKDYQDLEDIRHGRGAWNGAFPFQLDWGSTEGVIGDDLATVLSAEDAYYEERRAKQERDREYWQKMGPITFKMQKDLDLSEASISRRAADAEFTFQMCRFEEQMNKLDGLVRAAGSAIDAEHRAHMDRIIFDCRKVHKKYGEVAANFVTGEDVKARPHDWNAAEKKLLFALALRAQWALEEIYEIYRKRCNLQAADGSVLRPSCISSIYANSFRMLDSGIRAALERKKKQNSADAAEDETYFDDFGYTMSQYLEGYFSNVWKMTEDSFKEIGLTVYGTLLKFGGRKIMCIPRLDQLAGVTGSNVPGDIQGSSVYMGLEDKIHLLGQVPPHPDFAMVAGAQGVFPDTTDFFTKLNMSREAIMICPNHTGIREFLDAIEWQLLGIEAPQAVQQGVARIPVFGDYTKTRALVFQRKKGADDSYQEIINFLLRKESLLIYPAGTRVVAASGGNMYVDYASDPDQIYAYRIVTDRATTGLIPKIALSERKGEDFLIANVVHDGSATLAEPTWFLGESFVSMVLGNLSPKTMLNFTRGDQARRVAFGSVFSSFAFLTATEWDAVCPDNFKHADGRAFSERERYFRALQINDSVRIMAQRELAARMDLAEYPERTGDQEKRQAEVRDMDEHTRRRATEDPLVRYIGDRIERLQMDHVPDALDGLHKECDPLDPVRGDEATRLEEFVTRAEALAALDGVFQLTKKRAKDIMVEAVQRGAEFRDSGRHMALDLDKVIWDHFFSADPADLPSALQRELVHMFGLAGLDQADERVQKKLAEIQDLQKKNKDYTILHEHININPYWLAFLIGYYRDGSDDGNLAFFSSTISPRIRALAVQHCETNPAVRRFFELLLGDQLNGEALTVERAERLLSDDAIKNSPRLYTREDIAGYVDSLLRRYRKANKDIHDKQLSLRPGELKRVRRAIKGKGDDVTLRHAAKKLELLAQKAGHEFTFIECQDILMMLANDGDLHCKYRGIFEYEILVDDRRENTAHAASYGDVLTIHTEPWTKNPFRLYFVLEPGSVDTQHDVNVRMLQGRNGMQMMAIRSLGTHAEHHGVVHIDRRRAAKRVSGVMDCPARIEYTRQITRDHYEGPRRLASGTVRRVRSDLYEYVLGQDAIHQATRMRLARRFEELFENEQRVRRGEKAAGADAVMPVAEVKMRNAVALLDPEPGRPQKPLRSPADFECLTSPALQIRDGFHGDAGSARASTLEMIAALRHRDSVDLWEGIELRQRCLARGRTHGVKRLGQVVVQAAEAFFMSAQAYIGANVEAKYSKGRGRLDYLWGHVPFWVHAIVPFVSGDENLVVRLSYDLAPPKEGPRKLLYTMQRKLTPEDRAEAFGVVAERMVLEYLEQRYEAEMQSERVEDGTRDDLKRVAEEKARLRKEIAALVRANIVNDWELYLKAVKSYTLKQELWTKLRDYFSGPVALAERQESRAVMQALWKAIDDTRRLFADHMRGLDNADQATKMVDGLLASAIQMAGGAETQSGWLLFHLRMRVHEEGLDAMIKEVLEIPGTALLQIDYSQWLRRFASRVQASNVAERLVHYVNHDDSQEAHALLESYTLYLIKRFGKKRAGLKYKRLTTAAWKRCDQERRNDFQEKVHAIAQRLLTDDDAEQALVQASSA
jgi:hypothetical protein